MSSCVPLSKPIAISALFLLSSGGVKGDEWRDKNGLSCTEYVIRKYCLNGSYGPGWRQDVQGLFRDHADSVGFDASERCCECMSSFTSQFSKLNCPVRVEPDNEHWYDSIGNTCQSYRETNLCDTFGYGTLLYVILGSLDTQFMSEIHCGFCKFIWWCFWNTYDNIVSLVIYCISWYCMNEHVWNLCMYFMSSMPLKWCSICLLTFLWLTVNLLCTWSVWPHGLSVTDVHSVQTCFYDPL